MARIKYRNPHVVNARMRHAGPHRTIKVDMSIDKDLSYEGCPKCGMDDCAGWGKAPCRPDHIEE